MIVILVAAALAAQTPAPAPAPAPTPALRPGLEPLGFLVGHCWRGEFAPGGAQDVHCFEAVYDGQHVRDRHEVTGDRGVYRGETLYSVDAGTVGYTYWNSQGGVSRGTMRPGADRLDFGDETYRGPDGREARISTFWRRIGDEAYESVTQSADLPGMNRTVTYRRVADAVSVATTQAPDGSHGLVHEALIDASADEAWHAVSTAEGWLTWAVPVAWMDRDLLETSYSPGATPGDPSTIRQQIVARIPGRLLVFRTTKAPQGFPHFETFREVTHMIELEPAGPGRTRVRLTSAGYADTEAGRQLLGFFREGNRTTLEQLRERFRSGPIDWARRRSASTGEE